MYSFFSGNPETITFAFDKEQLNNVIDKFGTKIRLYEEADPYVASLEAVPINMRFRALQYLPYVEVLKPEWLRKEIIDCIKNNKYKDK